MAACLVLAQPVIGQEQSAPIPSSTRLPSGIIPDEIYGVACEENTSDKGFVLSLRCASKEPTKLPTTAIAVQDLPCDLTPETMMAKTRDSMNDGTPFFNVVWENPFTPKSIKGVTGFKGFYQKSLGNRYFWATCGDGRLTQVMVIMFAPVDNEKLKAEVEAKIFGVQPKDANSEGLKQ